MTVHGAGCAGSGGPLALAYDTLPWTGASFRSTTTGLGPSSLAVALLGFTVPGLPLATMHPAGRPGCDLLASADATLLMLPSGGRASVAFGMPSSTTFLGVVLRQQTVEIEVDPALQITAINSSNGLSLTVGVY